MGLGFFSSDLIKGTHLDVKLQVLIHGIDVVEDVMRDPRDDPHELRVMQLPLVHEKHKHRQLKSAGKLSERRDHTGMHEQNPMEDGAPTHARLLPRRVHLTGRQTGSSWK